MPVIRDYIRSKARQWSPPRNSGVIQMAAADVAPEPAPAPEPPPEEGNVAEATEHLYSVMDEVDRDGLRYFAIDLKQFDQNAYKNMTKAAAIEKLAKAGMDAAAAFADIQTGYGVIAAHTEAALRALGKVPEPPAPEPVPVPPPPPEPPPVPPPTQFDSFGGSYGAGHDPAFDHYPNGEDGPHDRAIYVCPAAGRVERYSFMSPLEVPHSCETPSGLIVEIEREGWNFERLDSSLVSLITPEQRDRIIQLGTSMHIAVLRFDLPLLLENGQRAQAIWIGHVYHSFATGQRQRGDQFCLCGNSGIEFERMGILAEASHGHICGSTDGGLSPNGNIDGYLIAKALGFNPRRTVVPGPNEYMSGMYFRGKRR